MSNYKHKSWYVHMICFVVPQQIFRYGNTWRFSTAPIESRGSRFKRVGRTTICWRKACHGWTSYDYTDRKTGAKKQRVQGYSSSAVQQLLTKICAQEDSWHADDAFATPAKIRLQQHLRTCFLKCDLPETDARQSAGDVLRNAAHAPASAPHNPSRKAKVWAPAAPASIDGQVVFGPWAMTKGPVTFQS